MLNGRLLEHAAAHLQAILAGHKSAPRPGPGEEASFFYGTKIPKPAPLAIQVLPWSASNCPCARGLPFPVGAEIRARYPPRSVACFASSTAYSGPVHAEARTREVGRAAAYGQSWDLPAAFELPCYPMRPPVVVPSPPLSRPKTALMHESVQPFVRCTGHSHPIIGYSRNFLP